MRSHTTRVLDPARLQDRGWESLAGLGREPQAEVPVCVVRRDLLADPLQLRHPRDRKMAVLQQHPVALCESLNRAEEACTSITEHLPSRSSMRGSERFFHWWQDNIDS